MLTITLTLEEVAIALRYAAVDAGASAIAGRLRTIATDVEGLAEAAKVAAAE